MGEMRTIKFSCDHADQRVELYCPHSAPHADPGVEPPVVAGFYCIECGAMDMYSPSWCFCVDEKPTITTGSFATPILRDLTNERRLEAERDQLRQQVEKLLGAVDAHRDLWKGGPSVRNLVRNPGLRKVWNDDHALYSAADQVRKELGE
jgi:hypothetical protein